MHVHLQANIDRRIAQGVLRTYTRQPTHETGSGFSEIRKKRKIAASRSLFKVEAKARVVVLFLKSRTVYTRRETTEDTSLKMNRRVPALKKAADGLRVFCPR